MVCGGVVVKTSGMETLLPVAGAGTEGSMTVLSFTELVRES